MQGYRSQLLVRSICREVFACGKRVRICDTFSGRMRIPKHVCMHSLGGQSVLLSTYDEMYGTCEPMTHCCMQRIAEIRAYSP